MTFSWRPFYVILKIIKSRSKYGMLFFKKSNVVKIMVKIVSQKWSKTLKKVFCPTIVRENVFFHQFRVFDLFRTAFCALLRFYKNTKTRKNVFFQKWHFSSHQFLTGPCQKWHYDKKVTFFISFWTPTWLWTLGTIRAIAGIF